jgi:hypothetical protein
MGMNSFAPFVLPTGTSTFVVKNITGSLGNPNQPKCVFIFNYPIPENGGTRDLMEIEGISEESIRASLLKGEINHKLRAQEVTILASDIDLLQFNQNQANFLYANGVTTGVQIDSSQLASLWQQDIQLDGIVDGSNMVFTIPSGKFLVDGTHKIVVYINGVKQVYLTDYFIAESGGPGTGYDTVVMAIAPQVLPSPIDIITADYYLANSL